MLLLRKNPTREYIEHKFFEAGHTHMVWDTDHSIIEKKKQESPNEHPRGWIQLVRMYGRASLLRSFRCKSRIFYSFRFC